MSINNSQCLIQYHPGKPTVSLALGHAVGKLVLNKDLSITR